MGSRADHRQKKSKSVQFHLKQFPIPLSSHCKGWWNQNRMTPLSHPLLYLVTPAQWPKAIIWRKKGSQFPGQLKLAQFNSRWVSIMETVFHSCIWKGSAHMTRAALQLWALQWTRKCQEERTHWGGICAGSELLHPHETGEVWPSLRLSLMLPLS